MLNEMHEYEAKLKTVYGAESMNNRMMNGVRLDDDK